MDGLDVDFSELEINQANITDSKNDCLDLSFGKYKLGKINLSNCGDKGLSVGEKSFVQIDDIKVKNSIVGVASKDVANSRGVPVVFAETWNDTITGDMQKYIFRIAPLSSWASGVIWKFAAQAPGVKSVVIVTENTDYGIPAAEECAKVLSSKGISSVTFGVDIGTQDFAGIVERV